MQPEEIIINALSLADIPSYTVFDGATENEYVVIVKTNSSREYIDVNRQIRIRQYGFLIHCFSDKGKYALATFSDTVADIIEDTYWNNSVNSVSITGGSALPAINSHDGYTLNMSITLNL